MFIKYGGVNTYFLNVFSENRRVFASVDDC